MMPDERLCGSVAGRNDFVTRSPDANHHDTCRGRSRADRCVPLPNYSASSGHARGHLFHGSRRRRPGFALRDPVRRSLGTSRTHPFSRLRHGFQSSWIDCRHSLGGWDGPPTASLAMPVRSHRIARVARRIHRWRAWRRLLLPVRYDTIFLSVSSDRSFPDRRALLFRAGYFRAVERIRLGLDSAASLFPCCFDCSTCLPSRGAGLSPWFNPCLPSNISAFWSQSLSA